MSSFHQMFGENETPVMLQILYTIVTIFFIFVLFKWFFQRRKKNLPPSPPKLPIIGNLHQLSSYPHRSLNALAKRYGPLMLLHLGKVPVLVVSSADAAREVMKTHDIFFSSRPRSTPADKIFYGCKDVSMSPYGEYWRQIRSICVLHLLSSKRIHSFRNARADEVALVIEKIKLHASSSSSPINLSEVLFKLSNDLVCRLAFGRKYSESNLREVMGEAGVLLGSFHLRDYIPWLGWLCDLNGFNNRLAKAAKELDDFLDGVVQEHESRSSQVDDHQDFVDVLLWVQKQNIFGFPIDRVTIKAVTLNMFGAGTDTSYAVMEWVMTEILRHPNIMKELQKEVRGVVGDITAEDLEKMPYLKAVIKETLRFHYPVPLLLPRQSTQDVKINGYDIASGTHLYVNYGAIAMDPASWDQPDEFQPKRFLNSSINYQGNDFQFIPFGAGRRICPGMQFAMSLIELALASLLKNFDWSLPDGEELDLTESTGVTIHKKSPLIVLPTPYTSG